MKTHKDAKPFRNEGWEHLEAMADIIPSAIIGAHVFAPSQGTVGLDGIAADQTAPASEVCPHFLYLIRH